MGTARDETERHQAMTIATLKKEVERSLGGRTETICESRWEPVA